MSSVTAEDVRTALNEIDEQAIPNSTIEQKIAVAEVYIQQGTSDQNIEDHDAYEHAVIQKAALDAFTSSPPQVQRSAVDASVSWNVTEFIEQLEQRKDEALEMVGVSDGGTSAAFFKHTDGILD